MCGLCLTYASAALFESDEVALVEVAHSLLECLLAHLEALVYFFRIALVAQIAVAVVFIEVVEQGI